MNLVLLLLCSIIGVLSDPKGNSHNYVCTGWSEWTEFIEFRDDLFSNHGDLKLSDEGKAMIDKDKHGNYRGDMCNLFDLDTYIKGNQCLTNITLITKTPDKKKFYGLGVVKTAGVVSLLGLAFAIVGTFLYSKRFCCPQLL
ncbi:hypothetical protein MACK_000497 [Theileria orientalis]|uniref:Uncharacterized protein n=1 Tax=Theileria orientalis TaxID=68886 RepID=A0A976QT85_THEOR|nr:hypothetical protein MACK_000497 [Theileria orientalis]